MASLLPASTPVSYAAMNVGIFAVFSHAGGIDDRLTLVQDYRGLAYRSPLLGGALAFFLISLIGIPFTGGFFGKFYVFASALHSGLVWLTIIGLVNSGIACYYYLRLLVTALFETGSQRPAGWDSACFSSVVACPASDCGHYAHSRYCSGARAVVGEGWSHHPFAPRGC